MKEKMMQDPNCETNMIPSPYPHTITKKFQD
jgi:hypothetical protein